MSTQVNYQELERLVSDQARVHGTDYYRNAPTRTRSVYDQTVWMGKSILEERDGAQLSPQTMVDMTVQSINNAIKALKSNASAKVATSTNAAAPSQSPEKVRRVQAIGPVESHDGDQSPAGAPTQATSAAQQRSTDEPTRSQPTAQKSAPESTSQPTTPVQPTEPADQPTQPSSLTPVTVATAPGATTQPTAEPEGPAASTQPTEPASAQPKSAPQKTSPASQPTAPAQTSGQDTQPTAPATTASGSSALSSAQPTATTQPADEEGLTKTTPAAESAWSAAASHETSLLLVEPSRLDSTRRRSAERKTGRQSVSRAIWQGLRWTLGFKNDK